MYLLQTEYKYCYDLVLHYVLHYLDKDLKEKKWECEVEHLWFYQFGRGAALPLTPEDEAVDLTPSPDEGPGPSNRGRYISGNRPKLSRQANVVEEHYQPTSVRYANALSQDFPYVDEISNGGVAMYGKQLNLRPKSVCECVHFSYSCSEIAETTFTVPVEINRVEPECSIVQPSTTRENQVDPSTPADECPDDEFIHVKLGRQDSEAFVSDRSECCTPTEDLNCYKDCQALFNTSSATGDEIFYSQLEEMTLSTISISEDLPTDATEPFQSTFCCEVFTPGVKEETNSVLDEELEEDKDRPEFATNPDSAVSPSHVQNHFTDCFPIWNVILLLC